VGALPAWFADWSGDCADMAVLLPQLSMMQIRFMVPMHGIKVVGALLAP